MASVELVGRLLISLAVVLGLIWVVARRVRGGKRGMARAGRLIDVLGRQQLSRNSSVAVVRVHDRAMVLGVTDGSVQLISEIELDAVQAALAPPPSEAARVGAPAAPVSSSADRPVTEFALDDVTAARVSEELARHKNSGRKNAGNTSADASGRLAGSALSPTTWKQTIEALRDMTARKG